MQITERLISSKRHTIGYVAGGVQYTRAQAIKEVRAGRITGARIANGPRGPYLISTTEGESLYSLETRVVASKRRTKVAAKNATTAKKGTTTKSSKKA